MLLSKACEYAIKACVYIASIRTNGRKASADEISDNIVAPKAFTSKILKQLGKMEVISSAKGPNGGFYLTAEQEKRPLISVIIAMDGERLFTGCAMGLTHCSETRPCPLHQQYGPIRDQLTRMMESNSIKSLAESYDSGKAFLSSITSDHH